MQADLEVIEVSAEEALAEARAQIRKERKCRKAAEAERSKLEQAQARLQAELDKERTRNGSESKVAQEELKALSAKNAELRTDHDKLKQEVDAQRKRAEELDTGKAQLTATLRSQKGENDLLQEYIKELEADMESKVQGREANLARLQEELHRAQQEKSEQHERADQLATKNAALTDECNSMKRHAEEKQMSARADDLAKDTQIQGLLTAREELETRLKATMTEASETKKELEVEKAKRKEGEEGLESYKAKYERMKKEKETFRQLLSFAEKEKKMAEEKLETSKQEQSRAQEERERMNAELEKSVKELETLKREKERTSQQQALQSPKPARPSSEGEKYYSPERTVPVTVRRLSPPGASNFLSSAVSPPSNSHTTLQQVQSGCMELEKCVGGTDMSRPLLEMLTPPHDGEDEEVGGVEVGRGVMSQEATTMRQQVRFGDTYMFQIGKRGKVIQIACVSLGSISSLVSSCRYSTH